MNLLRENEFGVIGKALTIVCVIVVAALALLNAGRGEVPHPWFFSVAVAGCLLFLAAKISVIVTKRRISFGSGEMTPAMANTYRAGYWLMCVGTLATFA